MNKARTSTPPPRRATIADVAAAAGVAKNTVSAIVNQRTYCYASEATRRRVLDAAAALGYRANPMARAIQGKATRTVGLVVTGFDSPEMSARKFAAFEAMARQRGHMTIAASAGNSEELEDQAIRWLLDRFVDGLAVYPTEQGAHAELRRLVDAGFPVVTFDGAGREGFPRLDDVSGDYAAGGEMIIRHLVASGRRRIGLLDKRERCFVNDAKIAGMERAMRDAGLRFAARADLGMPRQSDEYWRLDEFAQIRSFLADQAPKLDALACLGDAMGIAAIRYAAELGIGVPDDLAVTGYDGLALSGQIPTPLTTVYHASDRIGALAFELLEERLSGDRKGRRARHVTTQPELLARASSGAPVTDPPPPSVPAVAAHS